MSVVGVDACKQGWIAIELAYLEEPVAHFLEHIRDLAALAPRAEVIAIDIPIGLPVAGRRQADLEAKSLLGPRASSVFFTPPREALLQETHALATRMSAELTGVGMSQQSYALSAKILQVDAWLGDAPCRVVEVHPEVSFAEMLGHPGAAPKRRWAGMVERLNALADEGILIDGVTGVAAHRAAIDDMFDAAAAAWTARRVFAGIARSFPNPPEILESGESAAIWA